MLTEKNTCPKKHYVFFFILGPPKHVLHLVLLPPSPSCMAKDHLGPFGTSPWMENVECQKGENLSKM